MASYNPPTNISSKSSEHTNANTHLTATLPLLPNIPPDNSDAESVIDNTSFPDNNIVPNMPDDNLNDLDKITKDGASEDDKYLIPDMPDLFYPKKPCKEECGRSSNDEVPGLSRRSDSVSSLDSDFGSLQSSTISTSSTRSSLLKKRLNRKPRVKSKFADATITYIQERLEGRVFSGWLEERQRLESVVNISSISAEVTVEENECISHWRDVIEVDSCELDMIRQLDAVMSSVPGSKEGKKWINIKAPTLVQGYLLWLLLPDQRPPGHYWFRVTKVTRHPVFGLNIELTVLRSVGESDAETPTARARRIAAASATVEGDMPRSLALAWEAVWENVKSKCSSEVFKHWITVLLLPSNIAYGFRMLVLALVSITVGTLHAAREGFRLILCLMRETGTLIDKATPLFHIIVAFVEKIIGGFFMLLAMVYRDARTPSQPPPPPAGALGPGPSARMAIMGQHVPHGQQGFAAPVSGANRRFVPRESWSYAE